LFVLLLHVIIHTKICEVIENRVDFKGINISVQFSGVTRNFVRGGGGQQIQLRTEDRENGDLGAVAP